MALSENVLFKFGDYEFPSEYIAEGGYSCKPNQRQDLDPYTDATGLTHRNALQHTKTEVSITTRSNLTWDEMTSIIQGLTSNYITSIINDTDKSTEIDSLNNYSCNEIDFITNKCTDIKGMFQ